MRTLGLYVHLPFCRRKCLYCDFCSRADTDLALWERYVTSLCRDLAARATDCREYTVNTVYFGGGTPTLLPPLLLLRVLDCIRAHYRVDKDAEITLECNPATGGKDAFAALREGGFNRVSVGLQSTHENELRALGRIHTFADFEKTFFELRQAGFSNISADLMSGIPEQTLESYLESVRRLCALGPEHISTYGLILEEGTPLHAARERLPLPDEEEAREMYLRAAELLGQQGYRQYEISNFARAGYESRHNLKYWNCEEFLGFGSGAYSDFGGARFGYARDIDGYASGECALESYESPGRNERMNEYVMLRMRLSAGVHAREFEARFGRSFEECFGRALSRYEVGGWVRRTADGCAFTKEGFYVSNAILSEILDFSTDEDVK